jgi:hypothetical protein
MMVTDEALHADDGVPHLGPKGWFGIQDGGASSMVIGHNTLMKVMDHLGEKGVKTATYKFHPTEKVFAFGGDARREAAWSVRLPVWVQQQHGYIECFVVEGNTPLLIGRPILAALQVKTDFSSNTVSVLNNEWKPAVIGEQGEYLLQLDDGVFEDPEGALVSFDYITDETYGHIENTKDTSAYVTLVDYLTATGRSPPEKAFYLNYIGTSAMSPKEKVMPEFSEPKDIRREITDKLMKTMYMHFHVWGNRRTSTTEEILNTHTTGQRVFWEVYSGDGLLSKTFERNGWKVRSFDLTNGWDFEKASNR